MNAGDRTGPAGDRPAVERCGAPTLPAPAGRRISLTLPDDAWDDALDALWEARPGTLHEHLRGQLAAQRLRGGAWDGVERRSGRDRRQP